LSTAARARAAQHAREFESARKDFFGIGVGNTAELRGYEPPTLFFEQGALQLIFEQLDLATHGLRGNVHRRRRRGDPALANDAPEVEQVGVIEMAHANT